ncbi:MAG TPA: hypothetical protein VFA53_10340 [Xanthobacteraceae bacterium]|nr:hypothetical protein [Xanthobacteraceae bacterium]
MRKTLTVLAAAGLMGMTAIAAPAPAEARGNGGAVAAGVIGGLAAGAIIGSAASGAYAYEPPATVYYGAYPPRDCHWVRERVWTDYGPRWRDIRVCR